MSEVRDGVDGRVPPKLRAKLDSFARAAAKRLGLPAGAITIVVDDAQYLAATHGLEHRRIAEAEGTSIEWSFCANVVRSATSLIVEDAEVDAIRYDNPVVTFDGVRSYAGAPLIGASGTTLGACCVMGFEPHNFAPSDLAALQELCTKIVAELGAHGIS